MDNSDTLDRYVAIVISEVKSSSRELYPLTKNYPMCLLPVGTKKLIIYQLEALLKVAELSSNISLMQRSSLLWAKAIVLCSSTSNPPSCLLIETTLIRLSSASYEIFPTSSRP